MDHKGHYIPLLLTRLYLVDSFEEKLVLYTDVLVC